MCHSRRKGPFLAILAALYTPAAAFIGQRRPIKTNYTH